MKAAHAYASSSPILPTYSGRMHPARAPYIRALRPRPVLKLQLRTDRGGSHYVRAYLGGETAGRDGYENLWVMRKDTSDSWRLVSSSNVCTCGGLGRKNGEVHSECEGTGWMWRGEGEAHPYPPGELHAVLKLRRPEHGIPAQDEEYDSDPS